MPGTCYLLLHCMARHFAVAHGTIPSAAPPHRWHAARGFFVLRGVRWWVLAAAGVIVLSVAVAALVWRGWALAEGPHPVAPLAVENTAQHAAFTVCDRLLADFPADAEALSVRGALLAAWGQTAEAMRTWQAAVRLEPGCVTACEWIAKIALRSGDTTTAVDMYRRAAEAAPDRADLSLGLGKALVEAGQVAEAIEVLTPHVARWPDSIDALHLLGEACLADHRYQEAKEAFQRVVQAQAATSRTYYSLMMACRRLGEEEVATVYEQEFRRYKERERSVAVAQRRDHWDERSVQRRLADTYLSAAAVYQSRGQAEQAFDYWRRAAAADPTHVESRQLLLMVLAERGRVEEAARLAAELQQIQPHEAQHYLVGGRLWARLGRWDLAETALRKAAELAPNDGQVHAFLALVYLQSGTNTQQAALQARRAAELAPTAANYALLCEAYLRSGQHAAALAAIRRAAELAPDNPAILQQLQRLEHAASQPRQGGKR